MSEYIELDDYDDYDDDGEILTDISIEHETELAILVQRKNASAWFPKSVIVTQEPDVLVYQSRFSPDWKTSSSNTRAIEGDFTG